MRSEIILPYARNSELSDRVEFVNGQKTITASWSDDYPYQACLEYADTSSANGQKLTALAPAMDLIAIGTTDNRVSILRYPSLEAVVPVIELKSELVDLNWGGKEGKWVSSIYQNPGMS
jgi:prolactin regulatory element-binding protein